jgi:hypothetical protein
MEWIFGFGPALNVFFYLRVLEDRIESTLVQQHSELAPICRRCDGYLKKCIVQRMCSHSTYIGQNTLDKVDSYLSHMHSHT